MAPNWVICMRRSLGSNLREIKVYQGYVHRNVLLSLIITMLIVVPIHAFLLIGESASIKVNPRMSAGIQGSILIGLTSFILSLTLIFAIATFSEELVNGGALLALSHPISRTSYVLSWMIVSLVTTTLIYLLSIWAPLLIIDPDLLQTMEFYNVVIKILELFEVCSVLQLLSMLLKGRGKAILLGLALYYFIPITLMFFGALLFVPGAGFRSNLFMDAFFSIYPSYSTIFFGGSAPYWINTVAIAATAWVLSLIYAKYKMEVS